MTIITRKRNRIKNSNVNMYKGLTLIYLNKHKHKVIGFTVIEPEKLW